MVIVSNTSGYPIEYPGGFGKVWFDINYISNGLSRSASVWTPGGGVGLLNAHEIIKDSIEIPMGASEFRIGVAITSLTWRGILGRSLVIGTDRDILRLCGAFMRRLDLRNRSKTEWSDEVHIIRGGSMNTNIPGTR
jgi:hypothetical protein